MQIVVSSEQDGLMLSALLKQTADVPLWAIKEAIKKKDVRIDGIRMIQDVRVSAGQEIRAYWPKSVLEASKEKALPLPEIVYEDERVLLVNKPQGIPAQMEEQPMRGDSALTRAAAYLKNKGEDTAELHLCHRLDVQTGGLLMLTKTEDAYEAAVRAFAQRTIEKTYTCLVKGCPARQEAVIRAYLRKDAQLSRVSVTDYPARGSMEILTGYRVLEAGENARLQVDLITGRTHQIRAHLAHIGHPILGDDKYGDRALNRRLNLRRQQLWATSMVFHADGALEYLEGRRFSVNCPF